MEIAKFVTIKISPKEGNAQDFIQYLRDFISNEMQTLNM